MSEETMEEKKKFDMYIYGLSQETYTDFKAFVQAYAFGKYAIAIQLLLDRSAVLEQFSTLEKRIRSLENRVFEQQMKDGAEVVGKKTFGRRDK